MKIEKLIEILDREENAALEGPEDDKYRYDDEKEAHFARTKKGL